MWPLRGQQNGHSVGLLNGGYLLIESIIDDGLQQSYRETEYKTHGVKPLTMKVGAVCPALAAMHKRHRVDCSAFVTACNPLGKNVGEAANTKHHAALGQELDQRNLANVEGIGEHPSNQWPGEASFLIFGLTLEAAKTLGTRLEQNAIIWTGLDGVPQLVLLR